MKPSRISKNLCVYLLAASSLVVVYSNASAGRHFTIRIEDRRRPFKMTFSPDSKQLAITDSGNVYFVNVSEGELVSRKRISSIGAGFTATSKKLFLLMPDRCAHYDVHTGSKVAEILTPRPDGDVGLELRNKNGKLVVARIAPGSPASVADPFRVGDEIVGVANGLFEEFRSIAGSRKQSGEDALSGVRGSVVRIQWIPKGSIESRDISLVRSIRDASGQYVAFRPTEPSAQTVFGWLSREVELWNANRGR